MDDFISEVTITETQTGSGLTRTLPVSGLSLTSETYSRSGQLATELFDGRMRPNFDGFRHSLTIDWGMLRPDEMQDLRDLVLVGVENDAADYRITDPLIESGGNSIGFILSDASSAVRAVFRRNIRNTPASISFISREIFQSPIDL